MTRRLITKRGNSDCELGKLGSVNLVTCRINISHTISRKKHHGSVNIGKLFVKMLK